VLLVTSAALFVLAASELTIVASLRESGATAWTGLVIGLWCAYSLVGGFIYGALHRGISPLFIVGGLGALSIPVGLVSGSWWWLALALIPAGILCSPALASTVDAVSARVPASARGEAMGLHGTALTIGVAAGAPVAGAVIDAFGPGWGFAVAGGVGVVVTALAAPFWPRGAPSPSGGEPTVASAAEESGRPAPAGVLPSPARASI
jgi:MFS family permease